jgi:hypothetical protein
LHFQLTSPSNLRFVAEIYKLHLLHLRWENPAVLAKPSPHTMLTSPEHLGGLLESASPEALDVEKMDQ